MIHLGDKGYALNQYLITPLAHPNTDQERNFNSAHTRTRATVERCIGLLKGRWMSIGSAGGTLLYSPEKTCNIILACGVLHNIALANGVPFADLQPDDTFFGVELHVGPFFLHLIRNKITLTQCK